MLMTFKPLPSDYLYMLSTLLIPNKCIAIYLHSSIITRYLYTFQKQIILSLVDLPTTHTSSITNLKLTFFIYYNYSYIGIKFNSNMSLSTHLSNIIRTFIIFQNPTQNSLQ